MKTKLCKHFLQLQTCSSPSRMGWWWWWRGRGRGCVSFLPSAPFNPSSHPFWITLPLWLFFWVAKYHIMLHNVCSSVAYHFKTMCFQLHLFLPPGPSPFLLDSVPIPTQVAQAHKRESLVVGSVDEFLLTFADGHFWSHITIRHNHCCCICIISFYLIHKLQ